MSVTQAWMAFHTVRCLTFRLMPVPRIACADGFEVSIQAGSHAYCTPRSNQGPWTHLETGYPSEPVPAWLEYAEDRSDLCSTVYAYVPVVVIDRTIAAHGGIDPRLQLTTCLAL